MRKTTLAYGIMAMLLVFIISCKSNKAIPDVKEKAIPLDMLWKAIEKQNMDYEWYYSKANVQVSFEDFNVGGLADIRIRKDSVILFSVKKFGFELARALITRDSMFALNRLEGKYMALSIDSVQQVFNVPFQYDELQEIIVGNHLTANQKPLSADLSGTNYVLNSTQDGLQVSYRLNKDLQVERVLYQDEEKRSFELQLEEYQDFEGVKTASKRSYYYPDIANTEYSLKLETQKIEINKEKKIKFEIPRSYIEW